MTYEQQAKELEIPKQFSVTGQDIFNYLAKYGTSNVQLQAVIEFDRSLDEECLKRAVRLCLEAQPILGCQFIENDKQAYWQRYEDLDRLKWFEFVKGPDKEEVVSQFLAGHFAFEGQQVFVKLVRDETGDTLCVKLNHACSDGAGLKDYLQLLASVYSELIQNANFCPKPDIKGRRDQKHYFDGVKVQEPLTLFNPQAESLPATWAFPYHNIERKEMHIAMRRFGEDSFKRIKAFSKSKGVTINTVILTAYFRSLFKLTIPPVGKEMEIYVTADLRKFFEKDESQAICNLSSFMQARVHRVEKESFNDTLNRVNQIIKELKNNQAELSGAVVMEALGAIDYSSAYGFLQAARQQAVETGKSSPLLSNIGVIYPLHFGQIVAKDAYIVTPTMYAPGFMMGVSTYQNNLTLEVSYCEPSHNKKEIELFLENIENDLRNLEV